MSISIEREKEERQSIKTYSPGAGGDLVVMKGPEGFSCCLINYMYQKRVEQKWFHSLVTILKRYLKGGHPVDMKMAHYGAISAPFFSFSLALL